MISWDVYVKFDPPVHILEIHKGLRAEIKEYRGSGLANGFTSYEVEVWIGDKHIQVQHAGYKSSIIDCKQWAEIEIVNRTPLKELPLLIGSLSFKESQGRLQSRLKGIQSGT